MLEKRLVVDGLADNQKRAAFFISLGMVRVNGAVIRDRHYPVRDDDRVELEGKSRFVSRGGLKLDFLLSVFRVNVTGAICIDIGSSTGGFTDCLLQAGASRVYAVDVGYGQLAWKLRSDDRVKVLERTNFRYVGDKISEQVNLIVVDASFISLDKLFPVAVGYLKPGGYMLSLVKPQFEADRGDVEKGGIVTSGAVHADVLSKVGGYAKAAGLQPVAFYESPIKGREVGNREFLLASYMP